MPPAPLADFERRYGIGRAGKSWRGPVGIQQQPREAGRQRVADQGHHLAPDGITCPGKPGMFRDDAGDLAELLTRHHAGRPRRPYQIARTR